MFVWNAVQARFQYQMAEILFLEWHPHSFHVCIFLDACLFDLLSRSLLYSGLGRLGGVPSNSVYLMV